MQYPPGPDISDDERALDIELIATLYRAIGDLNAFDAMVDAVHRRYVERPAASGDTPDPIIDGQLGHIEKLLDEDGAATSNDPLERAVEEVPTSAVILDHRSALILANTAGEQLFCLRPGQTFSSDFIDERSRAEFARFTARASNGSNANRLVLRLNREAFGPDVRSPPDFAEALIIHSPIRNAGFVALRALDIPWTETVDRQLEEAFALTEAERAIARSFFETRNLAEMAAQRGTSTATVSTQLKTIYAKTETGNRADLLQLLSLLTARAAANKNSSLAEWSDPLGREQIIERPDGLKLAYSWQGAEHGRPILAVHGQSIAHIFPPEADEIFRSAGLKVIVMSRPGFGHSEYDPAMGVADEHAYAIISLCDALGMNNVPVIATSSGLVGLLRASQQQTGLIGAIFVGSYLWSKELPATRNLPTHQRIIFDLAIRYPRMMELLVRIGYRSIRKQGIDWYLNRLLGKIDVDMEFLASRENRTLINQAALHLLCQGPAVFVRELQQVHAPWVGQLATSDIPVLFAVPEHDSMFEFAGFKAFFAGQDHISCERLDGAGDLNFYQVPERIAEMAVSHFRRTGTLA